MNNHQPPADSMKPPTREELYQELIMLVQDLCDPEMYGHAMPPEVVKRASRIVRMTEANRRPGYGVPPEPRCAWCDAE